MQPKNFLIISLLTLFVCLFLINYCDKSITLFLYENRHNPVLKFLAIFEDGIFIQFVPIYAFCIIFSLLLQYKKYALSFTFLLFANVITQVLTVQLKSFFGRSRPFIFTEKAIYGFDFLDDLIVYDLPQSSYAFGFFDGKYCNDSFPSGHSSSLFCLAFSVGLLYKPLRLPLLIYATLVAIARVTTTIHYLSDVIFGAYLAFFVVYLGYEIYAYLLKKIQG